jgi:hypothetical protein
VNLVKELFPAMPSNCPSQVPLHLENFGSNFTDIIEKKFVDKYKFIFKVSLPKGFYRIVATMSANGDPKVARVECVAEIKN